MLSDWNIILQKESKSVLIFYCLFNKNIQLVPEILQFSAYYIIHLIY